MGWQRRRELRRPEVLILSTQGGIRETDGQPARARLPHRPLGSRAADAGRGRGAAQAPAVLPFAGYVTDPCDGRTQGTTGMMDSLPYRNDAAMVLRPADSLAADASRRARRRDLRQGPAGDDDGAGRGARPARRARARRRDPAGHRRRGRRQGPDDRRALRPRRDHARGGRRAGLPGLRVARRRLPVPRHRRHVAGRRRGARACRCRTAPWPRRASRSGSTWPARSARGVLAPPRPHEDSRRATSSPTPPSATRWSSTRPSAARPTCCCTSPPSPTPPACARPTVDDWLEVNRRVPRLVDALPNGPHPTVRVFLAGGVPEVMLHLRDLGLLDLVGADRVGRTLGDSARLVGSTRSGGGASASSCASATASIPTT